MQTDIKRDNELTATLAQLTGLRVTAKIQKGARLFEFSLPHRTVASVYTYSKARRWADGFRKGKRVQRETGNKWRYEVQVDADLGFPLARFKVAENAFLYILWAEGKTPLRYRVWDTITETFVDSLDICQSVT